MSLRSLRGEAAFGPGRGREKLIQVHCSVRIPSGQPRKERRG
jgi:hypothetical protein